MKTIYLLGLTLLLTGCDQPTPSQSNAQSSQSITQPSQSNAPSFGDRLAESATGGAIAGTVGGIAHAVTSHALNNLSEKRSWKRKIESHKQYSYSTHRIPSRRLIFTGRR